MTLYGVPIAWKSKRQTVRADSTCSAEYMAISDTLNWAEVWGFLHFFALKHSRVSLRDGGLPPKCAVWSDSTSAIAVGSADMHKPKARWMALRWHKVRDYSASLRYCSSVRQRADAFTKPPTWVAITALLGSEGIKSLSALSKP